jgi:hypothetical protein
MKMDSITFYLTDLYEKSHGYRPTWLPNTPIKIGDFGVIENEVFTKEGNLVDLSIPFTTETSENDSRIDLSSEKGIQITTKIAGKVEPKALKLGEADAGFVVEFNDKNSFVFKLMGTKTTIISNLGVVKQIILDRYEAGNWRKEVVVINELIEAKSATILLSGQSGTKIELKAHAAVHTGSMDIGDADLDLKMESGQTLAAEIIGKKGIRPLYRAIGIKKKWFSTEIGSKDVKSTTDKAEKEKDYTIDEIEMEKK